MVVMITSEEYKELIIKANKYDELQNSVDKGNHISTVETPLCEQCEECEDGEQDENVKENNFKFKKGDRVKVIGENPYIKIGEIGTIDEDDDYPFVNFDNGEKWAIKENYLEKINESEEIK